MSWKPGYMSTPKWTGRAEVLVMGGCWGGVENATGRAPSRVAKADTRILYEVVEFVCSCRIEYEV